MKGSCSGNASKLKQVHAFSLLDDQAEIESLHNSLFSQASFSDLVNRAITLYDLNFHKRAWNRDKTVRLSRGICFS